MFRRVIQLRKLKEVKGSLISFLPNSPLRHNKQLYESDYLFQLSTFEFPTHIYGGDIKKIILSAKNLNTLILR